MKYKLLSLLLLISTLKTNAISDTLFVYFLYGSKPKEEFKQTESKWFGGLHGGHVGIGTSKEKIYHFLPQNHFHIIKHHNPRNSKFIYSSADNFTQVFGKIDSPKMMIIAIPISKEVKLKIDSLHIQYQDSTPYDYAFIGMRCAAASYDVLAHAGIVKRKKLSSTVIKNFYPKPLRNNLRKKAKKKKWPCILSTDESKKRTWEKD